MATIILAGGLSTRMGRDKAGLEIGGSTLVELLAKRFNGLFGQVIVAARPDQGLSINGVSITHDVYENAGPLAGLHAGLTASLDDANLVLACDMPFASAQLAQHLVSRLGDCDAVVPMLPRGPEPLFAAYRKTCLSETESSLQAGRFRMRDVLGRLNVLYLYEARLREHDPDLRSFHNINTPEDYQQALAMLRVEGRS